MFVYIFIYVYVYMCVPKPNHEQDVAHGQFLAALTGLNSVFL